MTAPDKIRVVAELVRHSWVRDCPRCGAVPGDSCETRHGDDYGARYVHRERQQPVITTALAVELARDGDALREEYGKRLKSMWRVDRGR